MIQIQKIGLFHTPASQDELLDWIESLSSDEKLVAMTAMGMTWNLLAELINKSLENTDAVRE
jgi:hypothetical protein